MDSQDLRQFVKGVLFDLRYGLNEFADDTLMREEKDDLAADLIMARALEVGV